MNREGEIFEIFFRNVVGKPIFYRQENKLMQSKCAALETKNIDIISVQQSGLAGSSAALTGLHTRLDSLVEQLISTYNISDQDLEVNYFYRSSNPNLFVFSYI